MNKKLVLYATSAVAAVAPGFVLFRPKRRLFNPDKLFKPDFNPNKSVPELSDDFKKRRPKTPTFQTSGKNLLDRCGRPVILKGVNKLSVFDPEDPTGANYFPEIAETGSNCVRIVWEMTDGVNPNPIARLDQLISNAKANKLIPIVGLWDFTEISDGDGGFSRLTEYVDYWASPALVALIKKHQAYLIVNIANEAATGDETNPADLAAYATAYKQAVKTLRQAGIDVPLMIDGMDRGKSLLCFAQKGVEMLDDDPKRNLIFSFHAYWPKSATDADPSFIANAFAQVAPLPIVIVIGELAGFGAYPGNDTLSPCSPFGAVDYFQFAQRAESAGMGWMLWEWGPKGDPECTSMDITTDGTFQSIKATPNAWVRDLVFGQPFSLKNAQKTPFITSGFTTCS